MHESRPGRVVLVTGASGGMGRAIASAFAVEARRLVLADLREEPLAELAETLETPVEIVAGDICADDAPDRLIAAAGGPIDVVVHTAGVSPTMADGARIVAINFSATQRLVEGVLPHMAPDGVVVLIASMAGQTMSGWPFDGMARSLIRGRPSLLARLAMRSPRTAYPVSKRAVQLYAQDMAGAFGDKQARIVSLSPGIIATPMGEQERAAGPEMDRMLRLTPAGRMGEATEIAAVVRFLASSAASYITGTDILVDGGTIAGVNKAGKLALLRDG